MKSESNFLIKKDGYLQFDATTIQQYIKDRLNADPNSKFTDHNFEGSYLSTIIEIFSYTFNVMMYYLNQTSTESTFTDARLYENMNRIVKLLGYNPIGIQTSLLPFSMTDTVDGDPSDLYVIPRYSYFNVNGIFYSLKDDLLFRPKLSSQLADGNLLYQGRFYEYPRYIANGVENEIIFLTPGKDTLIDHFNIDIYVKSKNRKWVQWERTDGLVLKRGTDNAYEVRLNENKQYEIKFGNGINGKQLQEGDIVSIYYLKSDGKNNLVSPNSLDGINYIRYTNPNFLTIIDDIWDGTQPTIASPNDVSFSNIFPSTEFMYEETVEDIRNNAPNTIKRKYTLSKAIDYEEFIRMRYSNLIHDVKVMDNFKYMDSVMRYYKNLGLKTSNDDPRILLNHTKFADACSFNNMYIFVKPKIHIETEKDYRKFMPLPLKQHIINGLSETKQPTIEPILMDPIYIAIEFGTPHPSRTLSIEDTNKSKIQLVKDKLSIRNNNAIIQDAYSILVNYFSPANSKFGMRVDFSKINNDLLNIDGISDFFIKRIDSDYFYNGLSIIAWNEIYPDNISLYLKTTDFDDFKVPFIFNKEELIKKIEVI